MLVNKCKQELDPKGVGKIWETSIGVVLAEDPSGLVPYADVAFDVGSGTEPWDGGPCGRARRGN